MRTTKPFSIRQFSFFASAQSLALVLGLYAILPNLWAGQIAAGGGMIFLVFLGMHLMVCFFEWFFHRYLLHTMPMAFVKSFAINHRNHHALTRIALLPAPESVNRVVINRYPIVEKEQHRYATFPWWALLGFWAFFTPLIVLLQLLFPHMPFLLGGYMAVAWSMMCYEIFHAIEHRPYEWWKNATEHPRFGPLWRRIYGFHHMHHANIRCNEAIGGFFGLPVADWAFKTYHQPKELLLSGRVATVEQFTIRAPWRIVQLLDRWVRGQEAVLARSGR